MPSNSCTRPKPSHRGLAPELRDRYFRQIDSSWYIDSRLRAMVDFQLLNLSGPWPSLPAMDVILMRNVLVYFDLPTKRDIFARVRRVLRPDGYLFLGGAESTLNIDDQFERAGNGSLGCYRLKG